MSVLNEEEVDNTLVDSSNESPKRTPTPAAAPMIILEDISEGEEEEKSENESNFLSLELQHQWKKTLFKQSPFLIQ